MKLNNFSRPFILISAFSICLTVGCLTMTSSNNTEIPQSQMQNFYEQIKAGQYEEIYQKSSQRLHDGISKEIFVNRMKIAVGKMKEVDETLNFQKVNISDKSSEQLENDLRKFNSAKVEMNGKKVRFVSIWKKEKVTDIFKLRTLYIVEDNKNGGKSPIYYINEEKEYGD